MQTVAMAAMGLLMLVCIKRFLGKGCKTFLQAREEHRSSSFTLVVSSFGGVCWQVVHGRPFTVTLKILTWNSGKC